MNTLKPATLRFVLYAVLAVAWHAGLTAQYTRPARALTTLDSLDANDAGVELHGPTKDGTFSIARGAGNPPHTLATNITVPGDFAFFNATADLLICGRDAANAGVVNHYKFVAGSYALQSGFSMPALDFVGVAYDPIGSWLYLLDGVTKTVFRRSWDGQGGLSAAGIVAWADFTLVPFLSDAERHSLSVVPYPTNDHSAYLFVGDWFKRNTVGVALWGDSGVAAAPYARVGKQLPSVQDVRVRVTSASEGDSALVVDGEELVQVQVVDMTDGSVVGTATIPANESSVSVPLTSPLVIDRVYAVRPVGQPTLLAYSFLCIRRYGHPDAMANGVSFLRMHAPLGARVGDERFLFSVELRRATSAEQIQSLSGLMIVGVRSPTTGDPVIDVAGNALLNSEVIYPATGWVDQKGHGWLVGNLPIPNDSNLVGVVALAQFLLPDGASYGRSEVVGIQIRPAQPGGESAQSLPQQRSAAVKSWVDELKLRSGKDSIDEIRRRVGGK